MKAVFIGCVQFSHPLLERLLDLEGIEVAGVVTRASSDFNADFKSLEPLAQKTGAPCLNVAGNDQEPMAAWIRDIGPDVIFCIGWSYLLGGNILEIPEQGVIGYHPALLPRNRGRHPIVWALALGLEETGSTFFIMDEGADSGDIVSQKTIPINEDDDAASLYEKLQDAAMEQLSEITEALVRGKLERRPQNPDEATVLRKRGKEDGEIDWRQPAQTVFNLVRALARPYVGAHLVYNGSEPKVWKVTVVTVATAEDEDTEPGQVLNVEGDTLTVKCGVGAVNLVEHEIQSPPKIGNVL